MAIGLLHASRSVLRKSAACTQVALPSTLQDALLRNVCHHDHEASRLAAASMPGGLHTPLLPAISISRSHTRAHSCAGCGTESAMAAELLQGCLL